MISEVDTYTIILELVIASVVVTVGLAIFFVVIFPPIFNSVLLFFSNRARYRKWNGYYDIGFMTKPLMTKKGYLYSEYLKERGTTLIDEVRKGNSSEFMNNGALIHLNELEPTKEELDSMVMFKFEDFTYYFLTWPVLLPLWVGEMFKKLIKKLYGLR